VTLLLFSQNLLPFSQDVGAGTQLGQVCADESQSTEYRRDLWRLKYSRNNSSTDPFYWDERALTRSILWPPSASSSEPDYSDDDEVEISTPPPEDQLPIEDRLRLEDLWRRQRESESRAEKAWKELEAIHGWTDRGRQSWRVAHLGLPRIIPPWEIYTRVSRDAYLRNIYPTV
jgi:hypothetical protein